MKCQYPVFTGHRHNICGNSGGHQVKVPKRFPVADSFFRQCRHQFKSNSAATKFFIWIIAIFLFGIKNGNRRRQFGIGKMVIANDKIDAEFFCIADKVN